MAAMIKRKVKATAVTYSVVYFDEEGKHNIDDVRYFPGKISENQAQRLLSKEYPPKAAIAIASVETDEKMYAISVSDFIKNAQVIDEDAAETADQDLTEDGSGEEALETPATPQMAQTPIPDGEGEPIL